MNSRKFTTVGHTILAIFFMIFPGCENTPHITPGQNLEVVLSEITALAESEKNIVAFEIIKDERSGLHRYTNIKIVKDSKKIMYFIKGADPDFDYAVNPFRVECTDVQRNITIVTAPGHARLSDAIAVCLGNGNKTAIRYYPSTIDQEKDRLAFAP